MRIAKAKGKFKGRKPTARAKSDEVLKLLAGGLTKEAVAEKVGIEVASVYRIAREANSQRSIPAGDSVADSSALKGTSRRTS